MEKQLIKANVSQDIDVQCVNCSEYQIRFNRVTILSRYVARRCLHILITYMYDSKTSSGNVKIGYESDNQVHICLWA